MHRVLLLLCLMIAGCAAIGPTPSVGCPVSIFSGELTDGLVELSDYSARELLRQLPSGERARPFCWYQTAEGTIEALIFDVGYEFEEIDGEWRFMRKNDYVVMWHERKR